MIQKKDEFLRQTQNLTLPLTSLKGVGIKRADLLARKGLHSILDLLLFMPLRYQDRTRITPIDDAEEGLPLLVKGEIIGAGEERYFPSRKRLFKIRLRGERDTLELLWFQYKKPYLTSLAGSSKALMAYGVIKGNRGQKQMIHPEIIPLDNSRTDDGLGYYPVYPAVDGISANVLRSMIRTALDDYLGAVVDPIPGEIIHRIGLPDLASAIKFVHLPSNKYAPNRLAQLNTPFHKRLIFDRFFLVMLIIAFRKRFRERISADIYAVPSSLMNDLEKYFPFQMTPDQIRAIEDVIQDMTCGRPMNRLLMGDVGCGKTIVAVVAAYLAILNHYQVTIMVPTQVLANQHFEYFSSLSGLMGFRPVLLTGRLKAPERRQIYEEIGTGVHNLIIGTQALIQEKMVYDKLGLVIIDEQHRFGVRERAMIDSKGKHPHQLIMTATPIPRTLAITVFGDMDISTIKIYPKSRRPPVTTLVTKEHKRSVLETLQQKLSLGQKAFVICPVIDESEDGDLKSAMEMAEKLKLLFKNRYRVGLIHGRLTPDEKEKVMDHFRHGPIDLLVGTTVIEVGIDVPNATVMVIEHPECFGLAQLHQLRGRVGRGADQGNCFLILPENPSKDTQSRLQILVDHQDGFKIAQKDLELRGQGELTGMRQAGMGELDYADIMKDWELLSEAKKEAQKLVEVDPDLMSPENRRLKRLVESVMTRPLDF